MNEYKASLNPKNYKGKFTGREVDEYLNMSKDELKKVPLEILNEVCKCCQSCNPSRTVCSIGHEVHKRDRDKEDIYGDSRFSRHMPPR